MRLGESLPLDRGALGRVLLAFSGEPGALYDRIRREGYHTTRGERDPQLAGMAFPVHGLNRRLIGCVRISGPLARFTKPACARPVRALRKAVARLKLRAWRHGRRSGRAFVGRRLCWAEVTLKRHAHSYCPQRPRKGQV